MYMHSVKLLRKCGTSESKSSFEKHKDCVGNEGKFLIGVWQRQVEMWKEGKQMFYRVMVHPDSLEIVPLPTILGKNSKSVAEMNTRWSKTPTTFIHFQTNYDYGADCHSVKTQLLAQC